MAATFGGSDAVDRIEVFDVRETDVRHHAHFRPRDSGQLRDLSRVIHPEFHHSNLRGGIDPQQR
jgi:hypothetical protein